MSIFYKGEMVWAKVRGYAWWPALVLEPNIKDGLVEKDVQVTFLGDETQALVSVNKVANFHENYSLHSSTKNKKLMDVLKMISQNHYQPLNIQLEEKGIISQYTDDKIDDEESDRKDIVAINDNIPIPCELKKITETPEVKIPIEREQPNENLMIKPQETSKKKSSGKRTMEEFEQSVSLSRKHSERQEVKTSKVGRKIKVMEEHKLGESEDLIDEVKTKITRSKSKKEKIAMLTEPSLYSSSKSRKAFENENSNYEANEDQNNNSEETNDGNDKENEDQYEIIRKMSKTEKGSRVEKEKRPIHQKNTETESKKSSPKKEQKKGQRRSKNHKIDNLMDQLLLVHRVKPEQEEITSTSYPNNLTLGEQENYKNEHFKKESIGNQNSNNLSENFPRNNFIQINPSMLLDEAKMKEFFSVPLELMPGLNNLITPTFQSTNRANLTPEIFNNHYTCLREQMNNTISTSLSSYPIFSQDYLDSVLISKLSEENDFKTKIENQLKEIIDWLLGNFQTEGQNEADWQSSTKLANIMTELSKSASFGSTQQLKSIFSAAYEFLLKNKDLANNMDNKILANMTELMHEIKTQENENLRTEVSPPINSTESSEVKNITEETKRKLSDSMTGGNNSTCVEEDFQNKKVDVEEKPQDIQQSIYRILLRRDICRKLSRTFQETYKIEPNACQELVLLLEGRINSFFLQNLENYKKIIKILFRLSKRQYLKIGDLINIINMELDQFKSLFEERVQKELTDKQKEVFIPKVTLMQPQSCSKRTSKSLSFQNSFEMDNNEEYPSIITIAEENFDDSSDDEN